MRAILESLTLQCYYSVHIASERCFDYLQALEGYMHAQSNGPTIDGQVRLFQTSENLYYVTLVRTKYSGTATGRSNSKLLKSATCQ